MGTISGTSVSFGTATQFRSGNYQELKTVYDSGANKFIHAYLANGNGYCYAKTATISGTSVSFGSEFTINSNSADKNGLGLVYDTNAGKSLIVYARTTSSSGAKVLTISGTDITAGSENQWLNTQANYQMLAYHTTAQKSLMYYRRQDANTNFYVVATISGTTVSFGTSKSSPFSVNYVFTMLTLQA